MRICLLEGDMSRSGGTERMAAWLANVLCKEHQLSILSLRMTKEKVFFALDSAVKHQVVPAFPGKTGIVKQIRWIHQYIKSNCIDWIINVDTGIGFYGILATKGTKAETITWEHGNFYNNWGSKLFPYLRRYAAKHSDAVVVLTQRDAENYRTNIAKCAPIHVIPNPAKSYSNTYDASSKTILSVGHLLENKGYHRAVEMAKGLLTEHPNWQWIICGEGPERLRLEQMIAESGLEGKVLLPGLVKDMGQMYRNAAMLVLTSDMEGLPMVLLEGKSYGLPLVAFDIMTGPSDIIDDGVNGFLIKPFDLKEMEDRIGLLMNDSELRCQLSDGAKQGMEKFSEETILRAWKQVLKEK